MSKEKMTKKKIGRNGPRLLWFENGGSDDGFNSSMAAQHKGIETKEITAQI